MAVPIITAALIGGGMRAAVAGLGFGVVTFVGIDALYGQLDAYARSQMGQLGQYAGLVGLTGLPTGLNIVLSAYSVRLAMSVLKTMRLL
ncbi:MAG: DUF2523 family protein [Pseudomonadota bacterium]